MVGRPENLDGNREPSESDKTRDAIGERSQQQLYKGNARQLTTRALLSGLALGAVLSITNLYIGAKVGVTLGVGLTAVILGTSFFKVTRRWSGRDFHLLEANMLLAVAESAGYIVSPLSASVAAYMVITGTVIVWWQLVLWLCGLALLGVVIALPWKQLFVNRENYPFPEGTASAVAIKALYGGEKSELVDSQSESRWFGSATKQLLAFAAFAGIARLLQSTTIVTKLGISFLRLPEMLDDWYWKLSATHGWWSPSIAGATLRELTIRPSVDFALLGIGGLMGIRTGVSLLVGAFINYAVLAPWMVSRGDIASEVDSNGHLLVGFRSITTWSLWTGVALMTSAALWSLLVQRKAVSSLLDRRTWLLSSDNQESANEEIPF